MGEVGDAMTAQHGPARGRTRRAGYRSPRVGRLQHPAPRRHTRRRGRGRRNPHPATIALAMSSPVRIPPSTITVTRWADSLADQGQRFDRRRGGVQLTAAMVGDDQAVHALCNRMFRILGIDDAFHDQLATPFRADPCEFGPIEPSTALRRHQLGQGSCALSGPA